MNWREKGVERESERKWMVEMDGSGRILEENGLCVEEMFGLVLEKISEIFFLLFC